MLGHLVTVCLALLPFAQCMQVHKHMTQEEVRKTFQTGHDDVPEYEVVRIYHTLHKREVNDNSPRRVKVNALNRPLSLYLEPRQGLAGLARETTPIYTVTEDLKEPEGLKYTLQPHAFDDIGQVYQNVSERSAIIAYEGEDGETLVQGDLLEDLRIVPLPHRLHDIIQRETRELEDLLPDEIDGEADFRRSHHHVVFKRREDDTEACTDCIGVVEREISSKTTADDRSKSSIPAIVYPEMLVIVDFSLYSALGNNVVDAARYLLAFWNAVDLRYRLLEEPLIRLSIGGVILSQHPHGTPYLEPNSGGPNKLDADRAIKAMKQYFYRHDRLPFVTYDLAIAMTHHDMCHMKNGVCDSNPCGLATMGGACGTNDVALIDSSMALFEDNGGYRGIHSAAHELAHLMGVPHDGDPEAIDCPNEDGYLMARSYKHSENSFRWSSCSLEHLHKFLSAPKSTCLRNMPPPDVPLHRLLPGRLMTLDEQCGKFFPGSTACDHGQHVCVTLNCTIPGSTSCRSRSGAAEGSSCGVEMHCINGYCLSKKVKIVPN